MNLELLNEVVADSIKERANELQIIYGDNFEKIIEILKEEYKNVCDIKEIEGEGEVYENNSKRTHFSLWCKCQWFCNSRRNSKKMYGYL